MNISNFHYNPFNNNKQVSQLIIYEVMICKAENELFITKILSMNSKDIKKLLSQEDQKYIVRKKQQVLQNMPDYLKPNYKVQSSANLYATKITQNNQAKYSKFTNSKDSLFPSMFQDKSKTNIFQGKSSFSQSKIKIKEQKSYLPNTFSQPFSFQVGMKGDFDRFLGQALKLQPQEISQDKKLQNINQNVPQKYNPHQQIMHQKMGQLDQKQISFKKIDRLNQYNELCKQNEGDINQKIIGQGDLSLNLQSKVNPFAPKLTQPLKYSPFIPNSFNFLDIHTNKKTMMPNYISPQTYSMNLLNYAHNQKRQNTFNQGYSYPNVVMGGGTSTNVINTVIRQNPFKKTFAVDKYKYQSNTNMMNQNKNQENTDIYYNQRLKKEQQFRQNIQDVLKYTLADKRFTNTTAQRQNYNTFTYTNASHNNETQTNNMVRGNSSTNKQINNNRQRVLQNPFVRRPGSTYKH